jgi:protoporphyrin/coproporphyrin ferrochelatase
MEAVILLAHGAPENLDQVDEYVLRIRHGRPLAQDLMATIRDRYKLVGGSPLLKWTRLQAAGLQEALRKDNDQRKVYAGMKYSSPYIKEAVQQMISDGVTSARAICLAPQFSRLTIGGYKSSMEEAIGENHLQFQIVSSYAKHPGLIRAFAARLKDALNAYPGSFVIFTAHSLPERVLSEGDPYDHEVKETAVRVARACELSDWRFAYQSQGMTSDKWLGPTVEFRLNELAEKGFKNIVVMPIGFVCDHVEILYDIDVQFRHHAESKGMTLNRAESLNDSPLFIDLLHQLATQ